MENHYFVPTSEYVELICELRDYRIDLEIVNAQATFWQVISVLQALLLLLLQMLYT